MKVVIIRHAEVNFNWSRRCTSEKFDAECRKYDHSPIRNVTYSIPQIAYQRIYVSELSRSRDTAGMLFPEGKYYVKETKAPAGYQLSNDTFYFSIKENNVIVCMGRRNGSETEEPIVFTDEKDERYKGGGVMIQKLGDNNETLENAVFTIYDESGEPVKNIRTNASGKAVFICLPSIPAPYTAS